ncbi:hypothetical protein K491DRAFT_493924 [Lophiostoma macrostomum CBS 122681]|uniref:Uncharacterized protein n=1 Tax=Lophiostoma macrostomum CBS 122681 TaxID=1314788 RepID=A0A6A6T5D0_9PLEO|nr:hypothetical protein K491DRAFT_493924 [Lophiostoma macrostomum CBS 122681]
MHGKQEIHRRDAIFADTVHRLNSLITMVQTTDWESVFSASIKALPSLSSIMLRDGSPCDRQRNTKILQMPHPLAAFCKTVLETAEQTLEICLNVRLVDIASPADAHKWAGVFTRLTKLSIAANTYPVSSQGLHYLENVNFTESLPSLEELRFFSPGGDVVPDPFVDKVAQCLTTTPLKSLRVLRVEGIAIDWITLDFLQHHARLEVLVWNSIPSHMSIIDACDLLLKKIGTLVQKSAVRQYWVEDLYGALFLVPESIRGETRHDLVTDNDFVQRRMDSKMMRPGAGYDPEHDKDDRSKKSVTLRTR